MATTFSFQVDWTNSASWVDESANVLSCMLALGFADLFDSAAEPGQCTIRLDNSTRRYSPDFAAGALYGNLLPRRPIRIRATDGVSTWTLFRGFLDSIQPEPGIYGSREVALSAVDGIALLAAARISLPLQVDQRADQLIQTLVSLVYTPPATDYRVGSETYELAADRWSADRTSALDAIRECADSDFGRFFVQRDGTPTFYDRRWFFAPPSGTLDLADQPLTLELTRDARHIYNTVNVIAHPRDQVAVTGVLARAVNAITIPPIGPDGAGTRKVRLRFRESASGQFIGGRDLITPLVPYTDYVINEQKDGSGVDYTTSPYVSVTVADVRGSEMSVIFTNSALGPLRVILLQVRGKPVLHFDPLTVTREDATSQAAYQMRTLTHDLPLPADSTLPESLAAYLLDRYQQPFTRPLSLTIRDFDLLNGVNIFSLKLFDSLTLSDTQTGLSAVRCRIIRQGIEIRPDGFTVQFGLERADDRRYLALDQAGYAELDSVNARVAV